MANILSLGTENTADISALKEIIGEPQSGESPPTGLQRAIEDLQNEQSALEYRLESAEDAAMNANTAAQAAKMVAEGALPKKGGEMEGVITANYNLTAVADGMALPGTKMQLLAAPQDKSLNILYLSAASDHIFNSCLGFGNDAFRHGVSSNKLTIIRGVKEPVYEDDAVNKAYLDSKFVIGTYRGDGKANLAVNIGFKPKFLIIMPYTYYTGGKQIIPLATGGTLADGTDMALISFSANGFNVYSNLAYNQKSETYYYIAFK